MATYTGDTTGNYSSDLPATAFFPSLKIADFQQMFAFKDTFSEEAILQQMKVDRVSIHKELSLLVSTYSTLEAMSQTIFSDDTTAATLYQQAVFCLTASNLIGNRMATDATKDGADRQQALIERKDHLLDMFRRAIDQLKPDSTGYTMKVV
ncbi:head completion/stabilization protein [Hydrogenovibrio marinus]|uniref:Head protein n=1 Tax=Hydrogenovibrio marinus TaxID=28885 RepID=A0A066ZWX3_HYDMR|nr:head completion/stabilization protein [Hydrogenovibrio marinus]KDN94856.1 hypothetical protein EI16_00640 [Hydrogenovibrio marinus]BBN59316.1 hypothetical protein HVMH_0910 [Hydrogenovibrio marinus]